MFGTLRKHQQWIWVLVVTVIIFTFVIYFSPDAKFKGAFAPSNSKTDHGSINGRPIQDDEYYPVWAETKLNYFMRTGGREWPGNDETTSRNLQRDAIIRLFLLERIKQMDIHVSDRAVARAARERLGDFPLDKFEQEYLVREHLTQADFERYIRHETAIQQLAGVAGASGKLLSPQEAESLYRKQQEQVSTQVAGFWATNYLSKVAVTPEAISQFYSNRIASYRIPERIQVSYVEFNASNYLAEADKEINQRTNLDARVDEVYIKRGGTNTFKDTNGVPLTEAAAKAKIKNDARLEVALISAHRKAAEFGTKLLDQKQQSVQTFEKLAAAEGYPVKLSPPFSRMQGLEDSDLPPAFSEKAAALSSESPILYTPIPGEHAIYVLALKTNLPSQLPPLDQIRDKVTADFRRSRAIEMAQSDGRKFAMSVTNSLAQKKSFADAAAEAGVKPITVPPFSSITNAIPGLDERINVRTLENIAFELKPGQASPFSPNAEGGFVVYLKERIPAAEALVKAELPEYVNKLRAYRQSEAFNDWFRKEAEQSKLTLPRPPEITGGGR